WRPGRYDAASALGRLGRISGLLRLGRDGELRLEFQKALLADALDVHQLFEVLFEDGWLNVHAGELGVRPPVAPTTLDGSFSERRRESRLPVGQPLATRDLSGSPR